MRALRVRALRERPAAVATGELITFVTGDPQPALLAREPVELSQCEAQILGETQVSLDLGVVGEKRSNFGSETPIWLSTIALVHSA